MNIGIIIQTNDPEKSWNGLRFANSAIKQGHQVRLFLMGAGVEVESITHEKFNSQKQIQEFANNKGVIMACGTCLKARQLDGSAICPISNMLDCVKMVEWADSTLTF